MSVNSYTCHYCPRRSALERVSDAASTSGVHKADYPVLIRVIFEGARLPSLTITTSPTLCDPQRLFANLRFSSHFHT